MDQNLRDVIAILEEIALIVSEPNTDVLYSRYNTVDEALADIDQHIERMTTGDTSRIRDLTSLFAPTGSFQEIAERNGWGEKFLEIAARFDKAVEKLSDSPNDR